MATIPTMHTFTVGEVATAANLNNNTVSAFAFLTAPPLCSLRQTTGQSLPNVSTSTALLFDTEDIDTDNGHSTSSNTSRYVSQTAGWYTVAGAFQIVSGAGNRRGGWWFVNGAKLNASQFFFPVASAGSPIGMAPVKKVFLNVGDYIELFAYQDVGSPQTCDTAAGNQPWMTVQWEHT